MIKASSVTAGLSHCWRTLRIHYFPIMLCLCGLNALLGLFVPIYVDELVYKIGLGRYLLEGGQQLSIFPQCSDTFLTSVWPPLVPGAVMVAVAWQDLGLFGMRASGLVFLAAWLGLIWLILGCLTSPRGKVAAFFVLVLFLSFGVTTYALLLSRPDQFLVLSLTMLVGFPILARSEDQSRLALNGSMLRLSVVGLVYFLVLSLAAFSHPNLVYFTPVVIASIYLTFRPAGIVVTVVVVIAAVCIVGFGLQNGMRVAGCSDPAIARMTSMRLVDARGLLSAPIETIQTLSVNALTGFNGLLRHAGFAGAYQSSWLPATPLLDGIVAQLHSGAMRIVWHIALISAILVGVFNVLKAKKKDASLILAATLIFSLVGQWAHNRSLNFTLIELMVPLVLLFCLLVLAPYADRALTTRYWRHSLMALIFLSATSVLICVTLITPQLVMSSLSSRLFNDKQHHSYATWNASVRNATTARLAAACDIQPGNAPDLVLDDVSYATFRKDHRPMFATYVDPNMMGQALTGRLAQFLIERRSSGFIGKCNYLPHELQSVAIRDGEACCVSKAGLVDAAQRVLKQNTQ